MQTTPFLQELRIRTAASHQALENLPLSIQLLRDDVELFDYTRYLERLYGFVAPFEAYVFPLLARIIPGVEERGKTEALSLDLIGLGAWPGNLPVADVGVMTELYPSLAAAMGGMYVLEGSTLGGAVIARQIHKKLGRVVGGNTRYFEVYGAAIGSRWKDFLSRLELSAQNDSEAKSIIDAADQTFARLHQWMQDAPTSAKSDSWETTA